MSSSSSPASFDSSDFEIECCKLGAEAIQVLLEAALQNKREKRKVGYKKKYIERNREEGYNQLFKDYFSPQPTYPEYVFRRRFRMHKRLFLRVVEGVKASDDYFQSGQDGSGRSSISALQKCTAAIRLLAYGEAADRVDEYLRLSKTTAMNSLHHFTDGVISQFGDEYLRSPTVDDLEKILQINKRRGFPGMIGSIDCMHWTWKNCPHAWRGMFQGRSGKATVVLEAVATQDLWIWHAFFGLPGTCNDLTVLYRSPVFDDLLNGRAPLVKYVVNGSEYNTCYYLTDGIYPNWSAFVKSFPLPQTPKERLFAQRQEAVRKDVERAFGVLQARFAILRHPARSWDGDIMKKIMKTCIILHNMIVEDERHSYASYDDPSEYYNDVEGGEYSVQPSDHNMSYVNELSQFIANRANLEDSSSNQSLRDDLVEHIWRKFEGEAPEDSD